jgi:hypothetical protein
MARFQRCLNYYIVSPLRLMWRTFGHPLLYVPREGKSQSLVESNALSIRLRDGSKEMAGYSCYSMRTMTVQLSLALNS